MIEAAQRIITESVVLKNRRFGTQYALYWVEKSRHYYSSGSPQRLLRAADIYTDTKLELSTQEGFLTVLANSQIRSHIRQALQLPFAQPLLSAINAVDLVPTQRSLPYSIYLHRFMLFWGAYET